MYVFDISWRHGGGEVREEKELYLHPDEAILEMRTYQFQAFGYRYKPTKKYDWGWEGVILGEEDEIIRGGFFLRSK